ncbi:hypothetical protein [Marinobacterium aestuariivivens]|uniref:Uncharacterized protein n=1 Tax=Marinobacterium aestuariivivens TaxID=1698799 RepID=A0ABW1ZTS6_9GAMM
MARSACATVQPCAVRILGYPDARPLVGLRLGQLMPPLNLLLPSRRETIRRSQQPLVGLEVSPTLPQRGRLHWRLSLSALRGADQVLGVAIVIEMSPKCDKGLRAARRRAPGRDGSVFGCLR